MLIVMLLLLYVPECPLKHSINIMYLHPFRSLFLTNTLLNILFSLQDSKLIESPVSCQSDVSAFFIPFETHRSGWKSSQYICKQNTDVLIFVTEISDCPENCQKKKRTGTLHAFSAFFRQYEKVMSVTEKCDSHEDLCKEPSLSSFYLPSIISSLPPLTLQKYHHEGYHDSTDPTDILHSTLTQHKRLIPKCYRMPERT